MLAETSAVCVLVAVLLEMKKILLAKLDVPLCVQQLNIPGLCLGGPSAEIVGFSLDCLHIWGLILEVWVKPHSDSAVGSSDEKKVNYIHLGSGRVCVNATWMYLFHCTTPKTRPGSLSLTMSQTVHGNWKWHLRVSFISMPNIALMNFHVFSFHASRLVR